MCGLTISQRTDGKEPGSKRDVVWRKMQKYPGQLEE